MAHYACFVLTLMSCAFNIMSRAAPFRSSSESSISAGVGYLEKFGYIMPQDTRTGALRTEESLVDAIKEFQVMANITVTGKLDAETIKMMKAPRCGVADRIGSGYRAKRYALQGSKWRKHALTYRINNYPQRLNRKDVGVDIQSAFDVWSKVTPLTFTAVNSGKVNMNIKFARKSHGDGNPFDGEGYVLAHAFFPQFGGDTHFDDDEPWTRETENGVNLFQVAAHEIGHALGLSHSDVRASLMSPFYRGFTSNFKLHSDDVNAIRELYGKEPGRVVTEDPRPGITTAGPVLPRTHICNDPSIDAATTTSGGVTYMFKGLYYYRINNYGIAPGYPRPIARDWQGVTGPVDAILSWRDGNNFIFKGQYYWKFRGRSRYRGYPRKITDGFLMPPSIDTAFQWGANGKTYFTRGSRYFVYSRYSYYNDRESYYMSAWRGVPDSVDAAFRHSNGRTYFFKGPVYYRYSDKNLRVDSGYPRSIAAWWLKCTEVSQVKIRSKENIGDQYEKPLLPDFVWHKRSNTSSTDGATTPSTANIDRVPQSWLASLLNLSVVLVTISTLHL